MNNYQQFKTLSKTSICSFYEAFDKNLMRKVLLKRITQKQSWDQLLSNNNFIFSQKQSIFTKMIQVFKFKKYFFIAYERPTGPPLSQTLDVGKLQIAQFFMVFSDLCQSISILRNKIPNAYVQPEWVFLNRNSCKIGHFEPYYTEQNDDVHGHVYMYNLERAKQKQQSTTSDTSPQLLDKNTNLTFNLGCIAYQLLTGKKAIDAQTEQEYKEKVQFFVAMCQKRVFKATNNEKLAQFIGKMVSKNQNQIPTFDQIKNFSTRQNQLYNSKPKQPMALQVQLEKIKLEKADTNKKLRKFLRPCCKAFEDEHQKQHKHSTQVFLLNSSQFLEGPAHSKQHRHSKKQFLLNSSQFIERPTKSRVFGKGKSMFPQILSNRHRMSLRKSMATHKTKPTMFMSQDIISAKQY